MTTTQKPVCINCGSTTDYPKDACVLEALLSVLSDRGNLPTEAIVTAMRNIDAFDFWETIGGPAADRLEDWLFDEFVTSSSNDE